MVQNRLLHNFSNPFRLGLCLAGFCLISSAQSPRVICAEVAPFGFVEQGKGQGFAYELGEELLRRLGRPSVIELQPISRAISTIRQAEPVISLWVGRTPEREAEVQWISPIFCNAFHVYTWKGRPGATTLEKARGLGVLGANLDSDNIPTADTRAALANGLNQLELTASADSSGLKLKVGRIAGWVTSEVTAESFLKRHGIESDQLVRGVKLSDFRAYLVASLAVDQTEVERWQRAFEALRRDGVHRKLLRKYQLLECKAR
jgi:polar amino acid transport system substrate-binding protein